MFRTLEMRESKIENAKSDDDQENGNVYNMQNIE
jgi:hypothetical protein